MTERKYTFSPDTLEKLSTPELERILRAELDSLTPERETIMFVLSILEDRDPTNSDNRPAGAYKALENVMETQQAKPNAPVATNKARSRRIRGIVAAAVMVALILLLTVPQAVGADSFLEIIGRWTQDLFSFFESDAPQPHPQLHPQPREYGFQSENEDLIKIYNAALEIGISDPLVPTWLPEGYALQEIKVVSRDTSSKLYASFVNNGKYLHYTIELYSKKDSNQYPKDDQSAELYTSSGIYYYIVPNEGTWKVIMNDKYVECMVVTNESKEILYKILNSFKGRTVE